ncbi:hypothetical protein ACFQS1_38320 [Paractinoplanes rhizophilus]|uniref:Uncharacterized protein n=1 Tax=Paractinoplanes rhizophilus TaxID=1416877 RepID=A0ABW2I4X1_9ACTN
MTTPNSKTKYLVEFLESVGEMLDNILDALEAYTAGLPAALQWALAVVPLVLGHLSIVLAVVLYGTRAVRSIANAGWRWLTHVARLPRRPGR